MLNLERLIRYVIYFTLFGGVILVVGPLVTVASITPLGSFIARLLAMAALFGWLTYQYIRKNRQADNSAVAAQTRAGRKRSFLAYWLLGIPSLCLMALWTVSFLTNRAYLENMRAGNSAFINLAAASQGSELDIPTLLPMLDEVGYLAGPPGWSSSVPIYQRFGLNQTDVIDATYAQVYEELLSDRLLPLLVMQLEDQLSEAGNRPEDYEVLRLYLMLGGEQGVQYDPAEAVRIFRSRVEWPESLELGWHLDVLFHSALPTSVSVDPRLVTNVRFRLARFPLLDVLWPRISSELSPDDVGGFSVARVLGRDAALVFENVSGKSLESEIPVLYTALGYREIWSVRSRLALDQVLPEVQAVTGHGLDSAGDLLREQLFGALEIRYLDEYARHYQDLLSDLTVRPAANSAELALQLELLSDPQRNLMRQLAEAVVRETSSFDQEGDLDDGGIDPTHERLQRLLGTGSLGSAPGPAPSVQRLADQFRVLQSLLPAEQTGAPSRFDHYQRILSEASRALEESAIARDAAAGPAVDSGNVAQLRSVSGQMQGEGRLGVGFPFSVLGALGGQIDRVAGQELVMAPIQQMWSSTVLPECTSAIDGLYPAAKLAADEISRQDLARLFGHAGVFDQFFEENLAEFVDTSTRPWLVRPDSGVELSSTTVQFFMQVAAIRDTYLLEGSSGSTLRPFLLTLRPTDMDSTISLIVLEAGEEPVSYAHGPTLVWGFSWPDSSVRGPALTVNFDDGRGSRIGEGGFWGWQRLLDLSTAIRQVSTNAWAVEYRIDGKPIEFELRGEAGRNMITWLTVLNGFSCPTEL